MDFIVHGVNFYQGIDMAIGVNRNEDFKICNTLGDRFKIIHIISGNGVGVLNGIKISLFPGCLIVLNEKDRILLDGASHLVAHSLYFNPVIVNSVFSLDTLYQIQRKDLDQTTKNDHTNLVIFFKTEVNEKIFQLPEVTRMRIAELFNTIESEATEQDNKFWPCSIRQHTIQLLFLIVKLMAKSSQPLIEVPDSSLELQNIITYIHTFYHTKITLNSLAHEFNTNRTSLSDRFKKEFKMTVMIYLSKLRIHIAASLLKNTKLTIDEIARRIGFVDLPHFSRNFKRVMKTTPSEFRQAVC